MKGIVYRGNRKCEIRNFPDPVPRQNQVLVDIKASGICGSDLRWYRFSPELLNKYNYPSVIAGHETAGVVKEVGSCVDNVKAGDRVAIYHYMGCEKCYHCRKGEIHYCSEAKAMSWHIHGGIADVVLANSRSCLPMPDWLSFPEASLLMCAAGTAHTAMKYTLPSARDVAVVYGLGPVGLLVALYLKALEVFVIGIEMSKHRLNLAKKLGVDEVIDAERNDVVKKVFEISKGVGADVSFECTGQTNSRLLCTKVARKSGRVCLIGISHEIFDGAPPAISGEDIIIKELRVSGVNIFPIQDYWEALEFIQRRSLKVDSIVTHRFPLDQAGEAFNVADSGSCGKVLIEAK